MKKLSFILFVAGLMLFSTSCTKDQKVKKTSAISFEDIVLNDQGFFNGSDGSTGFTEGNFKFKINYSEEYLSWTGFAVTNNSDTITADYSNQYSSITGSGAGGTAQYAVLYTFASDTIELIKPAKITNIALSNTTLTYYTILNGNDYSKKFGGETGEDPDYFHLYLSVVTADGKQINFSSPIPLADYTFTDSNMDYISKTWEYYDLSDAGDIKYLIFSFDSSDKSVYGINTPAYVCIDNIVCEWEE
ncbi:MAG: DUF4465 domain-containing protein [Bacteroidales bacterium]|nr:DUF4465 domain-containing protein [Bacteroidales bacterium]MCB9013609.1 DUF4465 domain-containing protein [Bacteroidales bacterium]